MQGRADSLTAGTVRVRGPSIELDNVDLDMLRILEVDGRISKVALADKLRLSPSATFERMRRLEKAGVIRSYRAILDQSRFRPLMPFWVEITLRHHRASDFSAFERAIQSVPQITFCAALGGGIDYLMRVETTDIESYQRLIERLLEKEIGIDRYFTYIVTKLVKDQPIMVTANGS